MPAHPALRPIAPLLGLAVAEVVLEVLEGFFEVPDEVKEADDAAPDVAALDAAEDVPPIGAVDVPAISDRIDEEKVPDILVRLNW